MSDQATELQPLTPAQERVRRFIIDFLRAHHRQPTFREIAVGIGHKRNPNGVRQHLRAIARKGWIEYSPGRGVERMVGVEVAELHSADEAGNEATKAAGGINHGCAAI